MLTKRCGNCGQVKRVELFDLDPKRSAGRATQCKACRRQRQNRGGYAASRNRALRELARRHPDQYQRYRQQARLELAPGTAAAQVWDQARSRALAEISRRHRAQWHQHYRQVRAAHPTWTAARARNAATGQQLRAHQQEYLDLLASYVDAKPAGPRTVYRISRRAQRLLQLAHFQEYEALYAAERAKLGNPVQPPVPPQAGPAG